MVDWVCSTDLGQSSLPLSRHDVTQFESNAGQPASQAAAQQCRQHTGVFFLRPKDVQLNPRHIPCVKVLSHTYPLVAVMHYSACKAFLLQWVEYPT